VTLKAASEAAMLMADGRDEQTLARGIIEVHGTEAAGVARSNARTAALAGQPMQAKSWIRVLGIIQRHPQGPRHPAAAPARRDITGRIAVMHISLAGSRTSGFKKWADAHHPGNDGDWLGGATPVAIVVPLVDPGEPTQEHQNLPWRIPGVGGAF